MSPRTIKRFAVSATAFVVATMLWMACDAGKRLEPSTSSAAALERARMCSDGGAILNRSATGCVCPDPQMWEGTRCTVPPMAAPVATVIPPIDDMPAALVAQEQEAKPEVTVAPSVDQALLHYIRLCRRASGLWQANDQYCLCPKGQLLVGRQCRDVKGRLSDDLCERSPLPGTFVRGDCRCPAAQVFAPLFGGCIAPRPVQGAMKWRSCESTLNRGKWHVMADLCVCPTGRVWDGHLCQPKNRLSSRAVCESVGNNGQWQVAGRTCACGPARLWVDQACRPLQQLSPQDACKSDVNGGRWLADKQSCICPRLTRWDTHTGRCR